ncbi:MAG: ABC transporter ATP-binding protein [Arachnia sp.]
MTAALELVCVSKTHGDGDAAVTALDQVSLTVGDQDFVAVMGPSGSGKSTLLQLAGGLATPTLGEVLVAGQPLGGLSATQRALVRRRSVGYVFQEANLLPGLTAAENVAFPLELDGISGAQARREALALLGEVGVEELADRRPEDMSGGQAQRVAIARALTGQRRLLLADEPTGALDSTAGELMMRVLRERADRGVAVVLVTHDARFAAWADRTVFLRDGRCVDIAAASDPAHLLTPHA